MEFLYKSYFRLLTKSLISTKKTPKQPYLDNTTSKTTNFWIQKNDETKEIHKSTIIYQKRLLFYHRGFWSDETSWSNYLIELYNRSDFKRIWLTFLFLFPYLHFFTFLFLFFVFFLPFQRFCDFQRISAWCYLRNATLCVYSVRWHMKCLLFELVFFASLHVELVFFCLGLTLLSVL